MTAVPDSNLHDEDTPEGVTGVKAAVGLPREVPRLVRGVVVSEGDTAGSSSPQTYPMGLHHEYQVAHSSLGGTRFGVTVSQELVAHESALREIGPVASLPTLARWIASTSHMLRLSATTERSATQVAHDTVALLKQFLVQEAGTPYYEDALPILKRRLLIEPAMQSLLEGLLRRTSRSVAGLVRARASSLDHTRMIEEVEILLRWWLRRRQSLARVGAASSRFATVDGSGWGLSSLEAFEEDLSDREEFEQDALFNVRVSHDEVWAGLPGFRVSAGVFLRGRVTQPLWLKLYLSHEGAPVCPRSEFALWVDEADSTAQSYLGQGNPDTKISASQRRLSALIPLTSSQQRQIIDKVSLFVPYRSLDISDGPREVELELGLYDEFGFPVAETSILNTVTVSPAQRLTRARDFGAERECPSPQYLGVWEEDAHTGAQVHISALRLETVESIGSFEKEALQVVRVAFDLKLGASDFALGVVPRADDERSERRVRLQVIDVSGNVVPSRGPVGRDGEVSELSAQARPFVLEHRLANEGNLREFQELSLDLPLARLDLRDFSDEADLFVELSLVDAAGKVVCGSVHPLDIPLRYFRAMDFAPESASANPRMGESERRLMRDDLILSRPGALTISEQISQVRFVAYEITTKASSIVASRLKTVRARFSVCDDARRAAVCGARFVLETSSGKNLASSSVSFALDERGFSSEVCVEVSEHDVVSGLGTAAVFPLRLVARIQVLSADGVVLVEREKPISLSESSSLSEKKAAQRDTTNSGTAHTIIMDTTRGDGPLGNRCALSVVHVAQEDRFVTGASKGPAKAVSEAVLSMWVNRDRPEGNRKDPLLYVELLNARGEAVAADDCADHGSVVNARGGKALRERDPALLPGWILPLSMPDMGYEDVAVVRNFPVQTVHQISLNDILLHQLAASDPEHSCSAVGKDLHPFFTQIRAVKILLFSGVGSLVQSITMPRVPSGQLLFGDRAGSKPTVVPGTETTTHQAHAMSGRAVNPEFGVWASFTKLFSRIRF